MPMPPKIRRPVRDPANRATHQTNTTIMAAKMVSNQGNLPGDEESTAQLCVTIPDQQMGRLPVDAAMPFESNPSNLEPKTSTMLEILPDDIPWDVGPSFAYFPTPRQWTRRWNLSSASTRDGNSPPPLSPDSLEGTASMSSGESVSSESSPPVSYATYLFPSQSEVDDVWGLHKFMAQGLELDQETLSIPSPTGHTRDTVETPTFSRASTATVVPESESGLQESRTSQSSVTPGKSRAPSPTGRWACRECDKRFQDKTALKYAPNLIYPMYNKTDKSSKHLRYHSRPFSCPTCPRHFSVPKDLRRHQKTTGHGGQDVKELVCSEKGCTFKYNACRRDSYRRHLKLIHHLSPGEDMKSGTGVKCIGGTKGEQAPADVSCMNVE